MASYNNAAYSYAQVLAGNGYYMKDDLLRYSEGVKQMQEKLNAVGYNCGTADGKFGNDTDTAVRNFQRDKGLTVDGKAGKNTLLALDNAVGGGGSTGGAYPITFGTNQEVVYGRLRNAGLGKIAIAGIMGNIEAESGFSTAWGTSAGICQWTSSRKSNLEKFANSKSLSKTSIYVQADFILDECSSNGEYSGAFSITSPAIGKRYSG